MFPLIFPVLMLLTIREMQIKTTMRYHLLGHYCSFSYSILPLQSRINYSLVPTTLYLCHSKYFILFLYIIKCIINAFIPVSFLFSTLWDLELVCLTLTFKFMEPSFVKVNCSLIHSLWRHSNLLDIFLTCIYCIYREYSYVIWLSEFENTG